MHVTLLLPRLEVKTDAVRTGSKQPPRSGTKKAASEAEKVGMPGLAKAAAHQSPSGCRFTTRVRLRNRQAGFSAIAAANAARLRASERQIASVSSPYTRLSGLGG
jgi:hypothetical protein